MRKGGVQAALVLWTAAIGAGVACGTPEVVTARPFGWVDDVAHHPDRFLALVDGTNREGWAAIHRNDPESALPLLAEHPASRARADLAIAVLHADLARIERRAASRFFEAWNQKGFPADSAAPAIAALAAACHGDDWHAWAEKIPPGPNRVLFDALKADPGALFPSQVGTDALSLRRALHAGALKDDLTGLMVAARTPLLTEPGDGFTREFYDPCVHATLSRVWMAKTISDLGGPSDVPADDVLKSLGAAAKVWTGGDRLDGVLFTAMLSKDDLAAEVGKNIDPGLWGARQPGLGPLGIPDIVGDDGVEPARIEARVWNEVLDGWRRTLSTDAPADGQALLSDLGVVDRLRQSWLVARARLDLVEGRPKQALVLAEIARDVAHDEVGPNNGPSVYAVIAEAELANGRTREALDALSRILPGHPEATGVKELVGDLAVLEGIERRGDSKEGN